MTYRDYTLIGIDGGATKVSGWIIKELADNNLYDLSQYHSELPYSAIEGYISAFKPVDIKTQLSEREKEEIVLTDEELIQGKTYIESAANVIQDLYHLGGKKPVLIGIGMPGLKTTDQRGINAIANGPRMPAYCSQIEKLLNARDIQLLASIHRLGSDADYCGIGEFYASEGSFRGIQNAYYLGGGTGAADALLLDGKLIPFDQIKSWMAKTWEFKNDLDLSLERYASASGLQFIYSRHSGVSIESLNNSGIYPPQIAELAYRGDESARKTYIEVTKYLAMLLYERISTLCCGSEEILQFINPNRELLEKNHIYRNKIFDRIIIGQRLGDLMATDIGYSVLTKALLKNLSDLIFLSNTLPSDIKNKYLKDNSFDKEIIVFSKLREAPALGAGIDAHLAYRK
jgi:predicted NBD/HSP70 family sugar kinase